MSFSVYMNCSINYCHSFSVIHLQIDLWRESIRINDEWVITVLPLIIVSSLHCMTGPPTIALDASQSAEDVLSAALEACEVSTMTYATYCFVKLCCAVLCCVVLCCVVLLLSWAETVLIWVNDTNLSRRIPNQVILHATACLPLNSTRLDLTWLHLTWLHLTQLHLTWLDSTWLDSTWLNSTWLMYVCLRSSSCTVPLGATEQSAAKECLSVSTAKQRDFDLIWFYYRF